MITEGILYVLFLPIKGLLTLLPNITWEVDETMIDGILKYVKIGGYMLPMGTIKTIVVIIISILIFKAIISLIKTIWQLIPFV